MPFDTSSTASGADIHVRIGPPGPASGHVQELIPSTVQRDEHVPRRPGGLPHCFSQKMPRSGPEQ